MTPDFVLAQPMSALLDEVLEAHGGLERWRAARTVQARVRSGGLLIRTRVPGNRFADYRLTVEVDQPRAVMEPVPERRAARRVRAAARRGSRREDGEVLASRADPRAAFFGPRGAAPQPALGPAGLGLLRWLCDVELPDHATTADAGWRARQRGRALGEGDQEWRRLEVAFPTDLDTHSAHQTFYFDARGCLRRHDYMAEVVGGWARAAHH